MNIKNEILIFIGLRNYYVNIGISIVAKTVRLTLVILLVYLFYASPIQRVEILTGIKFTLKTTILLVLAHLSITI